jgi:hypothetical protein
MSLVAILHFSMQEVVLVFSCYMPLVCRYQEYLVRRQNQDHHKEPHPVPHFPYR